MDILEKLLIEFPYKPQMLKKYVKGEKNIGIMLSNGSIGVCSSTCQKFHEPIERILEKPNMNRHEHRVVINAWINANTNYQIEADGNSDIFSAVNFSKHENIVMIGYFRSLVEKLNSINIDIKVFDLNEQSKPVEPLAQQMEVVGSAKCLILTATSFANSSYFDLLSMAPQDCKTYILGPSTILSESLFELPTIEGLFGSRFKLFDEEVMQAITRDGGTRSFLGRMEKIFILKRHPTIQAIL